MSSPKKTCYFVIFCQNMPIWPHILKFQTFIANFLLYLGKKDFRSVIKQSLGLLYAQFQRDLMTFGTIQGYTMLLILHKRVLPNSACVIKISISTLGFFGAPGIHRISVRNACFVLFDKKLYKRMGFEAETWILFINWGKISPKWMKYPFQNAPKFMSKWYSTNLPL